MPEEGKQIYRERPANRFEFVNRELEGKNYVMGDQFTVADAYLYTVTRWTKLMQIDTSGYPNLMAHSARVEARAGLQLALQHEKAEVSFLPGGLRLRCTPPSHAMPARPGVTHSDGRNPGPQPITNSP